MNSRYCSFILSLVCLFGTSVAAPIRSPSAGELENLVGEPLPYPIKSVKWQTGEPLQTNLLVYAVQPRSFHPDFLKSLAESLGVHGDTQQIPASMILDAPGYWIKEPYSTNQPARKSVAFSQRAGSITFTGGEDNHRWDLKNHKPLTQGIPDKAEALQRTLALLPALGISTNDLEHLPDGRLKYESNLEITWYNDRHDNWKEKYYPRQINILFWQKIHDGAAVLPIGDGGLLQAGYISDGHLAELGMTFRSVKPIGDASPKTAKELVAMLKRGRGNSFCPTIPASLTVTNCTLVYPQANSMTKQDFLWPFYSLACVSVENGETNSFFIYEPLLQ